MAAGFIAFEITWRADVFSGAPQESSAADYGTLGINFRGRKPRDDEERLSWLDANGSGEVCEVPLAPSAPPGPSDES